MTETKQIPLKLLLNNTGQIEGLPRNPRQIRDEQYKRLLASLQESDLTDFKPLLVYPHKDKYIVLGGNMRLRALRELGADDVSCIVVPADTPLEQLKKVVILDNSQFGEYDWDIIANEWSDEPLQDWGLDVPVLDKLPTELQGIDLNPDELEDIIGDNETEMQRVIIVYKPEQQERLAHILGLEKIEKIVYNINEL